MLYTAFVVGVSADGVLRSTWLENEELIGESISDVIDALLDEVNDQNFRIWSEREKYARFEVRIMEMAQMPLPELSASDIVEQWSDKIQELAADAGLYDWPGLSVTDTEIAELQSRLSSVVHIWSAEVNLQTGVYERGQLIGELPLELCEEPIEYQPADGPNKLRTEYTFGVDEQLVADLEADLEYRLARRTKESA